MPYATNVCRIEPENNVHEVLEAFSLLPKHTLVIIGNWKNSSYGKVLQEKYSTFRNLILLDPIYDQRTLDVIRGNALLYVHGHSAGGTNPSLVEAMYLGLPVFAFGVSYNLTTTEQKARYFQKSADLKQLVEKTSIYELKEIGSTMKEIADRRYTWEVIASKYELLIEETLTVNTSVNVAPTLSKIPLTAAEHHEMDYLKYQNVFFENA
jgi:glycosyltransferase involved in cell wall biosynthesis